MCSCLPGFAIMADGVSCEGESLPPSTHLSGPGMGEVVQGWAPLCREWGAGVASATAGSTGSG